MISSDTIDKHQPVDPSVGHPKNEVACDHCMLYGFLQLFDKLQLDAESIFLSSRKSVAKGEILFHEDQAFHGIYAVKSGSFKSCLPHELHGEQILGFHLPGELMGLDAIHSKSYGCRAIALEVSSVCLLTLTHIDTLNEGLTQFQEQVIRILVDQVKHDQKQALMVGKRTAEERLGAFFLNLAERYAIHGLEINEFRMSMLQNDIANYLGMSMETVSRTLRSFRENELLTITDKRVRILNHSCLQSITQYCLASLPEMSINS